MKKEIFTMTDAEVKELEALIKKSADEIMSLSFWDVRCTEPECHWCGLRFDLAN